MTRDMTSGAPLKRILEFAFPVFMGILFQQFYSMVDAMIVGRALGLRQLAGVGCTSALSFLVIGCCNGVSNGFAIPLAQSFGAKDEPSMRRYLANGVLLSIALSLLIGGLTVVFCDDILRLLNTPPDVIEYAYTYIVVIFAGIPCTFLYNLTANTLRALGNSRTPLLFLIAASLLNIALDLLLILVFQMGVMGAALATVVSQGLSGAACLLCIRSSYPFLRPSREEWSPSLSYMRRLCATGLPMGLQYSITAIGSLSIQSAVNGFGAAAVAGSVAARKVHVLLIAPYEALGATMATYAGQNLGAGKLERVPRGLYAAVGTGLGVWIVSFLLLVLPFGKQLAGLFIDEAETAARSFYWIVLVSMAAGYPFLVIVNTVRYSLQGMGYSSIAMIAGVFEMGVRCIAAFVFVPVWGFYATSLSGPLAWVAADLFLIPTFYIALKKLRPSRS